MKEARLSSKNQIVIPKRIRDELGLRQGDKVRIEILRGRRAVLQAAAPPPADVFVRAGKGKIEEVLGEAKKLDELKIRKLLRSLGVND